MKKSDVFLYRSEEGGVKKEDPHDEERILEHFP